MIEYPDSDGVIRTWTKEKLSEVHERVHFSVPQNEDLTFPFIVLYRVAGVPDDTHDNPHVTFEVWGINKNESEKVARKLAAYIMDTNRIDKWQGAQGLIEGGFVVMGPRPMPPQPIRKGYRSEVTAQFMLRSM